MPSRANNIEYAIYVTCEVESGFDWGNVNFEDPITIGITQCYAYNAKRLLKRCRESDPGWNTFAAAAPRLANALDNVSDEGWTQIYITQAEANAWVQMSQSDENHAIQMQDAREEFNSYLDLLVSKGLSDDRPQTLCFAANMYHQSPQRCLRVLNACSPSATLDYMYQCCLNDSILGRYRNRYNTVYNRLKAWNGEDAPPDFGQNSGEYWGGQAEGTAAGDGSASVSLTRVFFNQGRMIAFGTGYESGIQLRETSTGNWIPERRNVTDGADATPSYTGGGSGDAKAICDLYDSWEKDYDFDYSQGAGRLGLPESGASDCSGSIWCAYHQAAGVDCGTWTGDMVGKGTEIASGSTGQFDDSVLAKMQPADLIIYSHSGSIGSGDHVEMYMGSGYDADLLGGGMAPVPHYKDAKTYTNSGYFQTWMVRRYL